MTANLTTTTEPSVTRFKERHKIMNHRRAFVMAVGLCLLASRQPLHAAMLAYEPFQGYSIATLNGQSYQGTGFAGGGSWANQSGSGASASATSLTYPGVVSTGGKAATPSAGFNGVEALLDVSGGGPFATAGLVSGGQIGGGSTSGTLYFGFLARNASSDVPDGSNDFAAFQLEGAGPILGVGNYWDAWAYSTFGVGGDQNMILGTGGNTWLDMDNDVHLFIGKIVFANGNDSITVWLDPILSLGDSQPNSTRRITASGELPFTKFVLRSGSSNDNNSWEYDELRFGTTFLSVVPEPTSMSLLAFGCLALLRLRSRKQ